MPANPDYEPIVVTADIDFKIWGVVIHIIHSLLTEEKTSIGNTTLEQHVSLA